MPVTVAVADPVTNGVDAKSIPSATDGQTQPTGDSSIQSVTAVKKSVLSRIERAAAAAREGHLEFAENQRGITYNKLFGAYVAGAKRITLKDQYIRMPYQIRNLAEFLETVLNYTDRGDEVQVHLVTGRTEPQFLDQQIEDLNAVQAEFGELGIVFTYEFSDSGHDRSIVTDTGWRVIPGRGLDIYQPYSFDWLNPLTRQQSLRRAKEFSVTYQRTDRDE
ncbi:MIT C-terminal domain-containing protein [Bifidobacterium sp. SO1]|nr:MIT C-terminal domain-containing protein [Bifidobacterium sp. SO1]